MKLSEQLIVAKSYIDTPGTWIKGLLATDKYGIERRPGEFDAVCFCSMGALHRAEAKHDANFRQMLAAFNGHLPGNDYYLWELNDKLSSTHTDMMKLWNTVIADVQQREAESEQA